VRALQRLEREGYILRRKDHADKRANLVQITRKGGKAVVEIQRLRKKIVQSFFGDPEENGAGEIVELPGKALTNEDPSNPRERGSPAKTNPRAPAAGPAKCANMRQPSNAIAKPHFRA